MTVSHLTQWKLEAILYRFIRGFMDIPTVLTIHIVLSFSFLHQRISLQILRSIHTFLGRRIAQVSVKAFGKFLNFEIYCGIPWTFSFYIQTRMFYYKLSLIKFCVYGGYFSYIITQVYVHQNQYGWFHIVKRGIKTIKPCHCFSPCSVSSRLSVVHVASSILETC